MPSVKMKTTSCGPLGNRIAGSTHPVSAEEGEALVAGGFAVWVEPPVKERPVEVAVKPAPTENAAARTGPARKRAR